MIKLRVPRWGCLLGLGRWAQCHPKGPYKKEAGGSESGRDLRMLLAMEEDEGAMSQRT